MHKHNNSSLQPGHGLAVTANVWIKVALVESFVKRKILAGIKSSLRVRVLITIQVFPAVPWPKHLQILEDKPMTYTPPSPDEVYENLEKIDKTDTAQSAVYRQDAVEVLADLDVDIEVREEIADRLGDANHLMVLKNVDSEDSY